MHLQIGRRLIIFVHKPLEEELVANCTITMYDCTAIVTSQSRFAAVRQMFEEVVLIRREVQNSLKFVANVSSIP